MLDLLDLSDLSNLLKMEKVSIVIPSYNEENDIEKCVQSIIKSIEYSKSIYNTEYNIIIVDSSTDNTKKIIKEMTILYKYIHMLDIKKNGISNARKMGTEYAINNLDSDIIVSTDSDVITPQNWLYNIYTHFHYNLNLIAITGVYKDIDNRFYESIATNITNNIFIGLGGNSAFRSDAYLQVDGYNIMDNTEDINLWKKLQQFGKLNNKDVIQDTNIFVYHNSAYRWRAAVAYPTSLGMILLGAYINVLSPIKYIGYTIGAHEIIKNGNRLKEIPYNSSKT